MKYLPYILMLLPAAALAQQPQPTPVEQALSERAGYEFNTAVGLRAQLIAAQREIDALKAQIKQLTDAAKDAPAKP
jgi:hypothetical protein